MNDENIEELKIGGIVKGPKPKKKGVLIGVLIALLVILVIGGFVGYKLLIAKPNKEPSKEPSAEPSTQENEVDNVDYTVYRMKNNELSYFDLSFLKLENNRKNMIYSPLSIKYTLGMLSEGANGETKAQIDNLIGDYTSRKYTNSKNMSFANALFVRDSYSKNIKSSYIDALKNKYDAEVVYDSFKSPDIANKWVKDKTFNLIDGIIDDISDSNFILANALAIDMEWKKFIQATGTTFENEYRVNYDHESYYDYINLLMFDSYGCLSFNGGNMNVTGVEFGASINKYDIVKELGEDKIRAQITAEYEQWVSGDPCGYENSNKYSSGYIDEYESTNSFVDKFIGQLNNNYKKIDVSTDFKFYIDDEIKIFEKELKEYNGTTLEFIALMPEKMNLNVFIERNDQDSINELINKLKPVELDSFGEGKVYRIVGGFPLFNYDYELDFTKDLNSLGIYDVFTPDKADLSNMAEGNEAFIGDAVHKANINFTNEGIKAAAATGDIGWGASICEFEHLYDVPVEIIDLMFDRPFMYIIRDKDTKEVWFVGSVYEPTKSSDRYCGIGGRLKYP